MSAIRRDPCPIVLGADVGGSWVRLVARRGDRRIGGLRIPATAGRDLANFFSAALRRRGWRDVAAMVVGSRGIWTGAERRTLARRFTRIARRVEVLSDAQIAHLGALGGADGLLILAGTGSIVVGCAGRRAWARAGGFGPLLGDEGSGFWIGRAWLRATTQGEDFLPARRLIETRNPVQQIAELTPMVFARARRGDRRARAIVAEAQQHLADQACAVVRGLRMPQPVTVSWAGSVMTDARYRAGIARAMARAGVRTRWRPPAMPPVEAAAQRAVELAKTSRRTRTS